MSKFFFGILVQTMTPKGHFEINSSPKTASKKVVKTEEIDEENDTKGQEIPKGKSCVLNSSQNQWKDFTNFYPNI